MDEIPVPSTLISDERRTAEILAITNDPMLPWAEKRKLLEILNIPQETIDVLCFEDERVHNPFDQDEDKYDPKIPTASLGIYKFIGEHLARAKDTHVNRASSASICYKRRWLQRTGKEGTPLTPRKMVNFLLGDLAEKSLLYFIKAGLVGEGKLYSEVDFGTVLGGFSAQGKPIEVYEQELLHADIGGIPVTAHVDGFGKRNSDGKYELIEIKSSSNYGFDDFKDKGPGDYLKQAHVNMRTDKAIRLGVESVRFFYLRKETGNLYDRIFKFDPVLFGQVVEEYKLANQAEEPAIPARYKLEPEMLGQGRGKPKLDTGRKLLPFPCAGYCAYTAHCYPALKMEWEKSYSGFMKPKYVLEKEIQQ